MTSNLSNLPSFAVEHKIREVKLKQTYILNAEFKKDYKGLSNKYNIKDQLRQYL